MQLNKDILSERYVFNDQIIQKGHLHYELIIKIIKLLKDENSRKIRKSCPLCNNLEANIISERDRYGLPVTFMICSNCSLIFSKEYFSDSFATFYYKTIYNEFKKDKDMSSEELFLLRTKPNSPSFKRYEFIKKILGKKFDKIETIIEPGCNDGCNLYPFFKKGKNVYGCDYDEKRISIGKKKGINILVGGVDKLIEINKKADLIIISHVLAHVNDFNRFILDVKKMLKPDGLIFVETPGFRGWWDHIKILKNYRKNFLDFLQFEFCYIFDLNLLKIFLDKHNFKFYKGNEYIRAIFNLDTDKTKQDIYIENKKNAKSNLSYLKNNEKNFLKFLYLKKKFLKLSLKKNEKT